MRLNGTLIEQLLADQRLRQFVRFGVVGIVASAVHYAVYWLLLFAVVPTAAYTAGYVVSFVGNYFVTCYYTFRTRPSWRHFLGFAGSHAVNFALHMVLFSVLLWLGGNKLIIPIVVMGISVVVQFTILRWVFTERRQPES